MKPTLPNLLTVFRLIAAPAVALVFVLLPRPAADWIALILFVGASLTDWLDGRLARAWKQESLFGAMLDPIADKAMIALALLALCARTDLATAILVPAALILFREVFVSGLREFLGSSSGKLKVTRMAKWKTTVQMVALSLLFASGLGDGWGADLLRIAGIAVLWLAAALTLITGWDYFRKALPVLKEPS